VSLGAEPTRSADGLELEGVDSSHPDPSGPEHEAPGHAHGGPGLFSELVLTAMVAFGVTLGTCAALYAAGVFNAPSHQGAPGSESRH
jgi:hypothetical protein